jgi:hypothetical protein
MFLDHQVIKNKIDENKTYAAVDLRVLPKTGTYILHPGNKIERIGDDREIEPKPSANQSSHSIWLNATLHRKYWFINFSLEIRVV